MTLSDDIEKALAHHEDAQRRSAWAAAMEQATLVDPLKTRSALRSAISRAIAAPASPEVEATNGSDPATAEPQPQPTPLSPRSSR